MSTLAAADSIAEALARIASALRTPVLVLALLVLLICALETGRFATELWTRWRAGRGSLRVLVRQVSPTPHQAAALSRRAPSASRRKRSCRSRARSWPATARHRVRAGRLRARGRAAPGAHPHPRPRRARARSDGHADPARARLAALGHGDVATLATDLRTAFAATTIGLLVGTVAFALTLTRTRMYSEDLTALERATVAPQ